MNDDKLKNDAVIDLMIDTLATIYEMEDKLSQLRKQLESLSKKLL